MYKALITDLDGTAIAVASDGSDIDDQTVRAIKMAIAQGKLVACATGREWEKAGSVIHKLGLLSPCIIDGGTRIIHPATGKTIWQKSFEVGGPKRVLAALKEVTDQGLLMYSADITLKPLASATELPTELSFIYLLNVTEKVAERIMDTINQEGLEEIAHMTPSWDGQGLIDVHITHREATKEHAIAVWQKMEKIKPEETIGMGDSGNDVPIFESCGLKIAVENASLPLKELADIIAPRYDQHALSYVIENYLNV